MIRFSDVYSGGRASPLVMNYLFKLMKQRMHEPHLNISATPPTKKEHVRFVHSEPYRAWYIVVKLSTGDYLGCININYDNEIGLVIERKHRGHGYGEAALRALFKEFKPLPAISGRRAGGWLANINPENWDSKSLFKKLGFKHIQETYLLLM